MARIKYAMSCNHTVTVVFEGGGKYSLNVFGDEEAAHSISDAINRGCRVRSTGVAAGDDWARLRARAMARQAAEMASGVRADTGRRAVVADLGDETVFDRIIRWLAGR